MFNFFKKKQNDFFVKNLTMERRNIITAVFFKHLSEFYASDSPELRIDVGNFDTIPNKYYFEVAKYLLKKMDLNISIEKVGEDATKPKDRYYALKVMK